MSAKTIIAWTDHTFNVAWGCSKVSEGCKNCYADNLSARYGHKIWGPGKPRRVFGDKHWAEPRKWDREAAAEARSHRVFCSSMCDVFEDHPTIDAERGKLWPLIKATPNLIWQLLTKRPERVADNLPSYWREINHRVWIGTSIENADHADRADHIRHIEAAVRFVSYEPALGPLAHALDLTNINWLIYGGESGPGWRPEDKQWARDMRSRCEANGTAFFHKQSAAPRTEMGIELDGQIVRQYPEPKRLSLALFE